MCTTLQDCDGNWCVEKVQYYLTVLEYDENEDDDKQLSSEEEEMASILHSSKSQVSIV